MIVGKPDAIAHSFARGIRARWVISPKVGYVFIQQVAGLGLLRVWEKLSFYMVRNTQRHTRRNLATHYDFGNSFCRIWLDEMSTCSAKLFETGQNSVEAALTANYASIVDRMELIEGEICFRNRLRLGRIRKMRGRQAGLRVIGLT
ncbi:class I SAM-dependent methyltransferase [Jannaschia seosinensis]|uniref:class I SAM-dependent methyltransferase n=1 Tax=Jannaschia seosinensis TaxID=313367 RepID=UPI0011874ED1|nr:class I SAM-dependent methyltransferase [Jannaschia seosinensis]